jgi:hypothetical protein
MAKKKRGRVVGYTIPIRVGEVRIPIHGKTIKSARAKANAFRDRHLKNVEQGFYNATGFHPIRASKDYDSAKVKHGGEGKRAKSRRIRHALGHGSARR